MTEKRWVCLLCAFGFLFDFDGERNFLASSFSIQYKQINVLFLSRLKYRVRLYLNSISRQLQALASKTIYTVEI